MQDRTSQLRRWGYGVWLAVIVGFALLHAWHLRADFPNGSPWTFDWAKFTDEGWYGNAAVRAHLFGNWYVAGDFNPAVAVPVWPFLEWLLFFLTGVTVEAARGLAVACFFASLWLSYLLLRNRAPRWIALLGVTLAVTSPFLYCFNRLAILEPLQTTLTLAALNLAVRIKTMRRRVCAAAWIGLLFALIVLTKTTGLFLLPALVWAMVLPLWDERKVAVRCAVVMAGAAGAVYGVWMALINGLGLLNDYEYFFLVANQYPMPTERFWQLAAFWWSFHGLLWVDHSLVLMAGVMVLAAAIAWRTKWGRSLRSDPLFGASLLGVAGFVVCMTLRDHPQPRYYSVPAVLMFLMVARGVEALVRERGAARWAGWGAVAAAVAAAGVHGAKVIGYATHPEYTWVNAATELTRYIDSHPNGNRLMVSVSGDEITLMTHLPTLCDELSTEELAQKAARHQPGWFSTWDDIDPNTLEDLHTHFSLEQVATYKALDDPDRDELVLFKLHPLPHGQVRIAEGQNLMIALPGDKIEIPIE